MEPTTITAFAYIAEAIRATDPDSELAYACEKANDACRDHKPLVMAEDIALACETLSARDSASQRSRDLLTMRAALERSFTLAPGQGSIERARVAWRNVLDFAQPMTVEERDVWAEEASLLRGLSQNAVAPC